MLIKLANLWLWKVGGGSAAGGGADQATNMLQKFWDSALALEPAEEDDDSHRFVSADRLFWPSCAGIGLMEHVLVVWTERENVLWLGNTSGQENNVSG